eukprot:scaffold9428_cov103-Cylindrotheca_fusiformis.AAC.2
MKENGSFRSAGQCHDTYCRRTHSCVESVSLDYGTYSQNVVKYEEHPRISYYISTQSGAGLGFAVQLVTQNFADTVKSCPIGNTRVQTNMILPKTTDHDVPFPNDSLLIPLSISKILVYGNNSSD